MGTFIWVGNHVGLDLVNTEVVDHAGEPVDLLAGPADLWAWAAAAEVAALEDLAACGRLSDREAQRLLDWTRGLRSGARQLLDPTADPSAAPTRRLAAVLADIPVTLTVPVVEGPWPAPVTASSAADRLRLGLALAVLGAFGLDRRRIRRCENEGCVLLYYDTSRNRSRRWCDMATCGNRAKAAAHYRRTKKARASGD